MNIIFRAIRFLALALLLTACAQSPEIMPSNTPLPTATLAPTVTPTPSQAATAIIEQTPTQPYITPTLIPTIDPTLVPGLLSKAISIQTLEGVSGHKIRQITGWDYGFGGGVWTGSCASFDWLDASHFLLHPAAGEVNGPEGYWGKVNVAHQPVVINLESGSLWLPPVNELASPLGCKSVHWSRDLGIFLISEIHDGVSTVSTYTYDGHKLLDYPGSLLSVSPSGTKILVAEDKLIDLRINKEINLNWTLEDYREEMLSGLFWTSDETRIYRCCYFYADLTKGVSYRFERSDFQDTNGNHLDPSGLWFYRGGWLQNSTYFLVVWSYVDDGDMRYLPMFDPATKLFYDVREMAGISEDLTCPKTTVSNNDLYVWIECYDRNYLVNLSTFDTTMYTGVSDSEIGWSADDKFALLESYDPSYKTKQFSLLSLSNKELKTLAINNLPSFWQVRWHPTDHVFAYISEDSQKLVLFNVAARSTQELTSLVTFKDFTWSPSGDHIALVAEDGSLWQVDYPNLENLEQLAPSLPDVRDVNWSPDGNSVSFISGSDIYIVDTVK